MASSRSQQQQLKKEQEVVKAFVAVSSQRRVLNVFDSEMLMLRDVSSRTIPMEDIHSTVSVTVWSLSYVEAQVGMGLML